MRQFIEANFTLVLIFSCFLGLFLPGVPSLPNELVVVALALLMFISCYNLRQGGLATIRWGSIARFYVLRYIVLPIALWAVAHLIVPDYAIAVFLLSLLPAGVASPAFANIYGGSTLPAFAIVIVSQLLTPFLIPLQFAWLGGVAVTPSPVALFTTMVWCIFLPMGVYALVRGHHAGAEYILARNKFFSMLLVGFVIALAVAKQRDVILNGGLHLLVPLVITILCFFLYIVAGWYLAFGSPRETKVSFAACSSFNNAALGVSLALLHFGPLVILFVAISEIAWSLLPVMFKRFLSLQS